jgi:hypothetical protein
MEVKQLVRPAPSDVHRIPGHGSCCQLTAPEGSGMPALSLFMGGTAVSADLAPDRIGGR